MQPTDENSQSHNCPFYGSHYVALGSGSTPPFRLLNSGGNQCGLVTTSYAPCTYEVNRLMPDWRTCIRVEEVRLCLRRA